MQSNCGTVQHELQKNAGMNAHEPAQYKICAASGAWNNSVWATCGISAVDCKQAVGKEEVRGKKPTRWSEVWINPYKFESVFNDQDIQSWIFHPQLQMQLTPTARSA